MNKTNTNRASLSDVMKLFNHYRESEMSAIDFAIHANCHYGPKALSALKQCSKIDAEDFSLDNYVFQDRIKAAIVHVKAAQKPATNKLYSVNKFGQAQTGLMAGTKTRSITVCARIEDVNGNTLGTRDVVVVIPQSADDDITSESEVAITLTDKTRTVIDEAQAA